MPSTDNPPGTLPLKQTQGFHDDPAHPRVVQKYGCLVLEVQDYIDGINHPEWGREGKQIFGPGGEPAMMGGESGLRLQRPPGEKGGDLVV
ncbi:hypothetical protein M501DRAFT_1021130 [Patellaria atrata CBS 101060]|uniref:Uncharacterized protein n=1 Tax=Patellaria atrata CBS 101060 TaxID=1346257 RepID=A0A9P4S0I6_9PEZI|nr:hypothetical protein M501DRAFT_1021130 [Patellaria atrata CBS 101060]